MSKIGVGVGDEFPVDDAAPKPAAGESGASPEADRAEFEEWKRRREAWRAQREAFRAQREEWRSRRREWKDRWRAERRAWQEEFRDARGSAAAYGGPWRGYRFGYGPWRFLWVVAAVTLVVIAVTHIGYVIVGAAALAILYAAFHHHGFDPLDFDLRDRSVPSTSAPKPATPPQDQAAS